MAGQEQPSIVPRLSISTDPAQGLPPVIHPVRSDTESSVSSDNYTPIPPGFYTLPIHGNCPRCHHYHKAATIKVRLRGDSSPVSRVNCEKCKQQWLAFGGNNSTKISLLSTQTLEEPDIVEQSFRSALVEMVRSVTAIASPSALATVQEKPSRGPSREHSVRTRNVNDSPTSPNQGSDAARSPQQDTPASATAGPEPIHVTDPPAPRSVVVRSHRGPVMFYHLKGKFKDRLQSFKKFRLRQFIRSKKQAKMSAKGRGKLPVVLAQSPQNTASPQDAKKIQVDDVAPATIETNPFHAIAARDIAPTPATIARTVDKELLIQMPGKERVAWMQDQFFQSKEALKHMTKEERIEWVREQFSEFKCRCPNGYYCKQATSSIRVSAISSHIPAPPPTPLSPPQRPVERRYSDDLALMGSHFHSFLPGELFQNEFYYETRPFSVTPSTRLSQTTTAINSDGLTVTSAAASPFLDIVQQQRSRSRSPRPLSLPAGPSHLRHSMGTDDSTPHLNGYRTSEELFRVNGSRSTTPMP